MRAPGITFNPPTRLINSNDMSLVHKEYKKAGGVNDSFHIVSKVASARTRQHQEEDNLDNVPARRKIASSLEPLLTNDPIRAPYTHSSNYGTHNGASLNIPNPAPLPSSYSSTSTKSTTPHTHFLPGTFEIVLIIDNREVFSQQNRTYIQEMVDALGISYQTMPLSLGDFVWCARLKSW